MTYRQHRTLNNRRAQERSRLRFRTQLAQTPRSRTHMERVHVYERALGVASALLGESRPAIPLDVIAIGIASINVAIEEGDSELAGMIARTLVSCYLSGKLTTDPTKETA